MTYLRHINLSEVAWGNDIPSVPLQLIDTVLLAVERVCVRHGIGLHGSKEEVEQIEYALSTALHLLDQHLTAAREANEVFETAYQEGRIYAAICEFIFLADSNREEDEAALEALLIYQLDRLIGSHKTQDSESSLHLVADIFEIQKLIGGIEQENGFHPPSGKERSRQARKLAEFRHKVTNKLKADACLEWAENGEKYSGMAAFARHRHKAYSVTERTMYGWVREFRNANT
ncbi:hypothetical protein [Pseudomonas anguilliseptica]|uniref:hypothetical protein n=1 Tax=Pseudomonas anguilliseptica TaxID=53406 RepID=UPI0022AF5B19|nr:hypothetical protein [Pseudomonas anguilliseptica]MCZ4322738.1 hypothetical protein [Pseudomonas anguilliseptica]